MARPNWVAFRFLGKGPLALMSRLMLLLLVGIPLLLLRCALAIVVGGGVVWGALAMTAGGTGTFMVVYRPAIEFMHTSDLFQDVWRVAFTEILPFALNICLFVVKLILEIWNGFCPWLDTVVGIVFDLVLRLGDMLWNQGILQYMLSWVTRLVVFMVEPVTDALVTVLESLMWAEEMLSDPGVSDVLSGAPCATKEVGEVLLAIVVLTLTIMVRYWQLFWQLMLPLAYTFIRMVLPTIIRILPDIMEFVTTFFAIFATDPAKRIIAILLDALPLVVDITKVLICSVGVYYGGVVCLMTSFSLQRIQWYFKYVLKPTICGGMSFAGGCMAPWLHMKSTGMDCLQCGVYNTACDCEANDKPAGPPPGGNKWHCHGTCEGRAHAGPIKTTPTEAAYDPFSESLSGPRAVPPPSVVWAAGSTTLPLPKNPLNRSHLVLQSLGRGCTPHQQPRCPLHDRGATKYGRMAGLCVPHPRRPRHRRLRQRPT